MQNLQDKKIAITHDYLIEYGGTEMVLWELLKIFPQADVYTALFKPTKRKRDFWITVEKHITQTSFINKLPFIRKTWKIFMPFYIRFFQKLDLSKYDLVISSSAAFAKYINTDKGTKHVAYIHTPPRFLWGYDTSVFHKIPAPFRFLARPILNKWRKLDKKYVGQADVLLANSHYIQSKIKEVYNAQAKVLFPPVAIESILNAPKQEPQDFYLTIGRIYDYKKIDVIVKAFVENKEKLVVIGDGPQRQKLEKIATKNIQILGFVDEDAKVKLLKQCKAFVFAADEDFGIVMVEALAAGKPVIAYRKGGALEIVQEGKTGLLFSEQTPKSLNQAIEKFQSLKYSEDQIIASSKNFTTKNFRKNIQSAIMPL